MTGSVTIPAAVDKSEVVGFEISRAFRTLDYQVDAEKNATFQLVKAAAASSPFGGFADALRDLAQGIRLTPGELEGLLGGPLVHDFSAKISGDAIEADQIATRRELPQPARWTRRLPSSMKNST